MQINRWKRLGLLASVIWVIVSGLLAPRNTVRLMPPAYVRRCSEVRGLVLNGNQAAAMITVADPIDSAHALLGKHYHRGLLSIGARSM